MKDVTIISKVVGRKEGDRPVTGGGSQAAVDLSAYLLKKTWDTAWELREKDGVLYLFGKLPVVLQSGMTSYVADEAVDLPGIYDGLPIDNQTLKWVETTDENGAVSRVLVAAGGGTGGGGSVKFPLTWSGFSNGSWDGSEAKTIVIPSKLSDLENDGFLHEGNYTDYEYTAKRLSITDIRNTTPKPSDVEPFSVTAHFANTDNPGIEWYSGLSIQGWSNDYKAWQLRSGASKNASNHLYFRNGMLETWNDWRRVITGDVNGVLDYDLTLGGSLNMPSGLAKIKSGEKSIVESYNEGGHTYIIGENSLYLTTKALFTIKDGSEYGILHEGNYTDYEYTAKRLSVTDIRNTTPKPSDIETFSVTAQFALTDNPGGGWFSGLSIQGWSNDYKAWQLRSGAERFSSNHLYFRNGVLETWNDWRRVITGDVDGVLDFNLELKGKEGGNIKFVYNNDSAITTNKPNYIASIRQALRFPWYGEAYEIGTIRGNADHSDGFGITHQNNHLVWKVNREQMDVYGDLRVKNGLIRYNEEEGYFYLEGNLVVSGGITAFADSGAGNQWILDATALSGVTSTNQYKVYSANVTTMLAKKVTSLETKLSAIKTAFNSLSSSSSASAIGSALKTLASKL